MPASRGVRVGLTCALLGACTPETFDGAFIDERELALTFPGVNRHATSEQDPRPMTVEVLEDLNAVLGEPVAAMDNVVKRAQGNVADRRDGPWGIYGPFEASAVDLGLPLAFLIRVDDRFIRSEVELWAAPAGATDESAFTRLAVASRFEFEGELDASLDLDLEALTAFPELAPMLTTRYDIGGSVHAEVHRLDEREVTVDLDDLELARSAPINRAFAGRGVVRWSSLDGGLVVRLTARGPFDDHDFTGPAANTMQLRARVAESGAGRIEGTVRDGDVALGPFTIVECWNPFLQPVYSFVDEAYQALHPSLTEGEEADCVFGPDALP